MKSLIATTLLILEKNAVLCAMEMMRRLDELNDKYRDRPGRDTLIGIGISYGEVVAGISAPSTKSATR